MQDDQGVRSRIATLRLQVRCSTYQVSSAISHPRLGRSDPHLDQARQARLDLQAPGLRRRILGRVRHG